MSETPLCRMWQDRLAAEVAQEQLRSARRAARDAELASWHEAWLAYKASHGEKRPPSALPRWWQLVGWARWLLRLHAPGRPD
jgi:hypothetical protein